MIGMPMGQEWGRGEGHRAAEMEDRIIENSHILRKGGGRRNSKREGQRSGRSVKHEKVTVRTKESRLSRAISGED